MAREVLIKKTERRSDTPGRASMEARTMVRKEQCPQCKGNKYIAVAKSPDKNAWVKCPSCSGQGYKIRLTN
jgi:DnaJ-class molecular chaperone